MVNDSVSDFITQIKNASAVRKEGISVPFSQMTLRIAKVLEHEGYLLSVSKRGRKTKKYLDVGLVFTKEGGPKVNNVRRISKPSRRVYLASKDINPVRNGEGILVLSTPDGVITGSEARKRGVGGEALFEIW